MEIFGLILMSLAILMYCVIPPIVDFNATHASNSLWPKHARFHVVSQVLTTSFIGLVALGLVWLPTEHRAAAICLAVILSACVLGGFFISLFARNLYGGSLNDEAGGIAKFKKLDLNTVNFGSAAALLIAGRALLI